MKNVSSRFASIAAVLLLGCGGSSYMVPVAGPGITIAPTAQEAVVVFIRLGGAPNAMTIFDEKGQFIGDSMDRAHFETRVPAGDHIFMVWGENTSALTTRLAGGKTYFIYVDATKGATLTYSAELFPLTPTTPNWSKRKEWLQTTQHFLPDKAAGQAYLDSRRDTLNERIATVRKALAVLPPDQPPSLGPNDGLAPGEDPPPAGAAAPKPPPPPHPTAPPPPPPPHGGPLLPKK